MGKTSIGIYFFSFFKLTIVKILDSINKFAARATAILIFSNELFLFFEKKTISWSFTIIIIIINSIINILFYVWKRSKILKKNLKKY